MEKTLILLLVASIVLPFAGLARPVSEEKAGRAAKTWVGRDLALGKMSAEKTIAGNVQAEAAQRRWADLLG